MALVALLGAFFESSLLPFVKAWYCHPHSKCRDASALKNAISLALFISLLSIVE